MIFNEANFPRCQNASLSYEKVWWNFFDTKHGDNVIWSCYFNCPRLHVTLEISSKVVENKHALSTKPVCINPRTQRVSLITGKKPLRSLAMLEWKLTSSWIGENCYRWAIYALMNEYRWQLFWKSIRTNINQGVVIKTIKEVPLLFWNNDGYM